MSRWIEARFNHGLINLDQVVEISAFKHDINRWVIVAVTDESQRTHHRGQPYVISDEAETEDLAMALMGDLKAQLADPSIVVISILELTTDT
jgi:hypothetical protein